MLRAPLQNVSRETMDCLTHFEQLVLKWTRKINLVSQSDAALIWERHILDSVQVFDHAPIGDHWLDIGSGGGFPGIVAAILSQKGTPIRRFTLVDSDQRKCVFLRTAARELGLKVTVIAERVQDLAPIGSDIFTARALSSLDSLLHHAERHLSPTGAALFPKGATWEREHLDAKKNWSYDLEVIESKTNSAATILKIKELSRV
jgi:16S rRNA (guanine527-N7)-methyltransferase